MTIGSCDASDDLDHVDYLGLDQGGEVVHLLEAQGVGEEGNGHGEGGGHGGLVELRRYVLLTAIGQRMSGAARRRYRTFDLVDPHSLVPRSVIALADALDAGETRRNVVDEVGCEDLATHNLIEAALAHTGGNQIRAAALLGINRNTLRKKIVELAVEMPRRERS